MHLRNLSLVVAALVAASAAVHFLTRPAPPAAEDPRVGQSVLAPELAARAARVRLTDQGKEVVLERQADGSWVVPTYHGFAADFTKFSRLVSDLGDAKVKRLVTTRTDRLARLEFKDTAITLQDSASAELWRLTLGRNADTGGRYLRYGDEQKGYLAALNVWIDGDPKNWVDTTLLDLKQDAIGRIEVNFASGESVAALRSAKDQPWTGVGAPAGKQLRADKLNSLASSLVALRFSDTAATDDAGATAARAHQRTVKLTTFEGLTYTIALGRTPEQKKPKAKAPAPTAPASTASDSTGPIPQPPAAEKPAEPEFDTIPAGPVFAEISSSDAKAPVNALMKKRSFQVYDWTFTSLPATAAECWEDRPAAAPVPPAPAAGAPAPTGK